jgi:hypothetical protein
MYRVTYTLSLLTANDEYPTLDKALARIRQIMLAFPRMVVTLELIA